MGDGRGRDVGVAREWRQWPRTGSRGSVIAYVQTQDIQDISPEPIWQMELVMLHTGEKSK